MATGPRPHLVIRGHRSPVRWVAAGGLGLVLSHGGDDYVRSWDAATGEPIGTPWRAHGAEVLSLTALRLRDGRTLLVTGGNDDAVRRWDANTGEPIGELTGHDDAVTALCHASIGGRDIVFGQVYRGLIHRWDALTGEPTGPALPQEGARYQPGRLVTDGQALLSVDSGGTPWLWDLAREEPVQLQASRVKAVALVPLQDGPVVVTGAEHGRLRRWHLAGTPAGADLLGHGATVNDLAAASTTLVSSARDGVRCWDTATGAPVGKKLPMALFGLAAVRLPDGRLRLASGSDDGFLLGDPLAGTVAEVEREQVWSVAAGLLPGGRAFFAGACADGRSV